MGGNKWVVMPGFSTGFFNKWVPTNKLELKQQSGSRMGLNIQDVNRDISVTHHGIDVYISSMTFG